MDQNTTASSVPVSDANASATSATNPAPQPAPASAPNPAPAPEAVTPPAQTNPLATPPSVPMGQGGSAAPGAPAQPHKGKPMVWVVLLLLFALVCGLALAWWYFQTQLQKVSPTNQTTQANPAPATKKNFIIGTDATFPPMEYTASGGAMMGYDIDLGKRIGQELGVTVTFKNIAWDDLFKALTAKQVDMIVSSVTITDERKQQYDFSDNYLNAGQVIIMRRDSKPIASIKDLQGKKIAVQQGTTNETEALKLTSADLIIRYPDFQQATKALVDSKADAILSDLPGAKGIVTENPTLKIMSDPFTNEYYGIVFRKDDPNVAKINDALSSLRTKGVLTDLKQKWLD